MAAVHKLAVKQSATICRDETEKKDSIQVNGRTSDDDLSETGLPVSKSKVAKYHIDGANKQAISTVSESEAGQPASLPNVTDDTMEQLNKADNVNVDVLLDHDPDLSNWPYPDKAADSYSV